MCCRLLYKTNECQKLAGNEVELPIIRNSHKNKRMTHIIDNIINFHQGKLLGNLRGENSKKKNKGDADRA